MFSDLTELDLEKQVKALTKEVDRLRKTAARQGAVIYGNASEAVSDTYSDLSDYVVSNLPALRRRARAFEKTAYEHPAAVAVVGLVVIGLVASLFLRRSEPEVRVGQARKPKARRS